MTSPFNQKAQLSHKKGVVLGLTIAEVILLLLFAILLALAASLTRAVKDGKEATAIVNRFGSVIEASYGDDAAKIREAMKKELEKQLVIDREIEAAVKRFEKQLLPDDVFQSLSLKKIDLDTVAGREEFYKLVNTAIDIKRYVNSKTANVFSEVASACELGAKVAAEFSPEINPKDALTELKDLRSLMAYWRTKANQCGLGGTLPNCYRDSPSEPFVYLFNVSIMESGIQIDDAVPPKYRERYAKDFSESPQFRKVLSDSVFSRQTYKYLEYGEKKECRFYVRVCDRTGEFQKKRYKDGLKAIEGNFYKYETCAFQMD